MRGSLGDLAVPHETRDRTDQGAEHGTQYGSRLKEDSAEKKPAQHGTHPGHLSAHPRTPVTVRSLRTVVRRRKSRKVSLLRERATLAPQLL